MPHCSHSLAHATAARTGPEITEHCVNLFNLHGLAGSGCVRHHLMMHSQTSAVRSALACFSTWLVRGSCWRGYPVDPVKQVAASAHLQEHAREATGCMLAVLVGGWAWLGGGAQKGCTPCIASR